MIKLQRILPTLYVAQQGRCFHCGELMRYRVATHELDRHGYTKEHLVPKSRLTKYRHNNIVLAHKHCNQSRADALPSKQERRQRNIIYREAQALITKKIELSLSSVV